MLCIPHGKREDEIIERKNKKILKQKKQQCSKSHWEIQYSYCIFDLKTNGYKEACKTLRNSFLKLSEELWVQTFWWNILCEKGNLQQKCPL